MQETAITPGDVLLRKYRVERVLGQGGMGVVVAARHVHLNELFAIKFLSADAHRVPDAVARFLREARASARLRSEHVAKVHDVGHLDTGMPYMVMEYLTGRDLKKHVRSRGRLPLQEAVALMLQACDAVAEAHAIGIIHRDLKPSNLFVTQRRDGTPCLKVIDFGIAKEISAEGADLTKSGATLGSPLYMSPEQMIRSKGVDTRTDIWSLGVVLYEIITGKLPFYGDTLPEIIAEVLQTAPKRPSELLGELPSWVDEVVLCCLEKHPERRFLTIDDLAAALREGCKLHPGAASASTSVPEARGSPDIAVGSTALTGDTLRSDLATATTASAVAASGSGEPRATPADGDLVPAVPITQELVKSGQQAQRGETASTTLAESTWGKTGGDQRPQRSKNSALAAGIVAVTVLGTAGIWITNGGSSDEPARSSSLQAPATGIEASPAVPPSSDAPSAPSEALHDPAAASSPSAAPSAAVRPAEPTAASSSAAPAASAQTATGGTTQPTRKGTGPALQLTTSARASSTAQPTATASAPIATAGAPTSTGAPSNSSTKSETSYPGVY